MMNKKFGFLIAFLFVALLSFTSCEETKEVDEYVNWKEKNEAFLDSLVNVVNSDVSGKWTKYKAWNNSTGPEYGSKYDYIYVKDTVYSFEKQNRASKEVIDLVYTTDSVRLNYRGRLIDNKVFDTTYPTTLAEPDPDFITPTVWRGANIFVSGFTTALLHMRKGDKCEVYIPWALGYGTSVKDNIPAYSVLIFELGVVDIKRP